jgi:hypothetical protein
MTEKVVGQEAPPKAEPKGKAAETGLPASHVIEVHHTVRTLAAIAQPGTDKVSGAEADALVTARFREGWGLMDFQTLGLTQQGISVLWVFGRSKKGAGLTEAKHVSRSVSSFGAGPTVTGFQADAYLAGYLADGWRLAFVRNAGYTPEGLNMVWLLVR